MHRLQSQEGGTIYVRKREDTLIVCHGTMCAKGRALLTIPFVYSFDHLADGANTHLRR